MNLFIKNNLDLKNFQFKHAVYNEVVKAGKSKVGAKNLQNALEGIFLCKNKF